MKKTRILAGALFALLIVNSLLACQPNKNQEDSASASFSQSFFSPTFESSSESSASQSSEKPSSSSASTSEKPAQPVVSYAKYIRCTGNSVNIRSGAGTSHSVLGSAEKGTTYAVLGYQNGWYKTYYRNQTAYVSATYASVFTLEKTNDKIENVIAEGYKLLGVPYVYGAVRVHDGKGKLLKGFSVNKFDCSSLVQYVFYKGASVLLNTNTRTQIKQGKYVNPNDLQRGDCIFFTNEDRQYNTGIERVGHVAIYLGNNYILHTSSDYARIEQISSKRWSFYIEARRFL